MHAHADGQTDVRGRISPRPIGQHHTRDVALYHAKTRCATCAMLRVTKGVCARTHVPACRHGINAHRAARAFVVAQAPPTVPTRGGPWARVCNRWPYNVCERAKAWPREHAHASRCHTHARARGAPTRGRVRWCATNHITGHTARRGGWVLEHGRRAGHPRRASASRRTRAWRGHTRDEPRARPHTPRATGGRAHLGV
jgi:hypothetical protein